MLHQIAVSGYRSLKDIVLCLGQLNVITGPNGSGKSNIYKALRLLAALAEGRLVQSLAREGGLQSTLWAGPEVFSRNLSTGVMEGQFAGKRKKPVALQLGFTSEEFSYTIDLGLPARTRTAFNLDPIIKRECLWRGTTRKPRFLCADRRGQHLRVRPERKWEDAHALLTEYFSMLTEYAQPEKAPEIMLTRERFATGDSMIIFEPIRMHQLVGLKLGLILLYFQMTVLILLRHFKRSSKSGTRKDWMMPFMMRFRVPSFRFPHATLGLK